MNYYQANTLEKRIYECDGKILDEDNARALIKEYTERIEELEDCLQTLIHSYGPDSMDLIKERMEMEDIA